MKRLLRADSSLLPVTIKKRQAKMNHKRWRFNHLLRFVNWGVTIDHQHRRSCISTQRNSDEEMKNNLNRAGILSSFKVNAMTRNVWSNLMSRLVSGLAFAWQIARDRVVRKIATSPRAKSKLETGPWMEECMFELEGFIRCQYLSSCNDVEFM